MPTRKFWIRKDREQYLLTGVILTSVIGGFVSSYWHFSDRLNVRRNIQIKKELTPEDSLKRLKSSQAASPLRGAATRYYQLEDDTLPSVPRLEDSDDGE